MQHPSNCRIGQRIVMYETTWISDLKCQATGWLASFAQTAQLCSSNLVLKGLPVSPI